MRRAIIASSLVLLMTVSASEADYQVRDITRFGVKFDGATDNTAALQKAFDWVAANGGTLEIPAAALKAKFTTAVATTLASGKTARIVGEGSRSGLEYTGTGTAITLNYNDRDSASYWRDFELCTTGNSSTAIKLQDASGPANPANTNLSTVERVIFRGCDGQGTGTQGWAVGVHVKGVSNVSFKGTRIYGGGTVPGNITPRSGSIGVKLEADPTNFSVAYNFADTTFYLLDEGIRYGTKIQGVTVSGGSNFTYVNKGINIPDITGTSELTVTGSQFDFFDCGICGSVSISNIADNLFYIHADGAYGISFNELSDGFIHHNTFADVFGFAGTGGIELAHPRTIGGSDGIISENNFAALDNGLYIAGAGNFELVMRGNTYQPTVTSVFTLAAGAKIISEDRPIPFANTLPCDLGKSGRVASISDSNTRVWGRTIAGGGLEFVLGQCDGADWTVFGAGAPLTATDVVGLGPTDTLQLGTLRLGTSEDQGLLHMAGSDIDRLLYLSRPNSTIQTAVSESFRLYNTNDAYTEYGRVGAHIVGNTPGAEEGTVTLSVTRGGLIGQAALTAGRGGVIIADSGSFHTNVPPADGLLVKGSIIAGGSTEQQGLLHLAGQDIDRLLYLSRPNNTAQTAVSESFRLYNSSSAYSEYGRVGAHIVTNTAGAEEGSVTLSTTRAGLLGTAQLTCQRGGCVIADGGSFHTTTPPTGGLLVNGAVGIGGITSPQGLLELGNVDTDRLLYLSRPNKVAQTAVSQAFRLYNASNAYAEYARVGAHVVTNTAGAEEGSITLSTTRAGSPGIATFTCFSGGCVLSDGGSFQTNTPPTDGLLVKGHILAGGTTEDQGIMHLAGQDIDRLLYLSRPNNAGGTAVSQSFRLYNSSSAYSEYGRVGAHIVTNTAGAEEGTVTLSATRAGLLGQATLTAGRGGVVISDGGSFQTNAPPTDGLLVKGHIIAGGTTEDQGIMHLAGQDIDRLLYLSRPNSTVQTAISQSFRAYNGSSAYTEYGRIGSHIVANTPGAEEGTMTLSATRAGIIGTATLTAGRGGVVISDGGSFQTNAPPTDGLLVKGHIIAGGGTADCGKAFCGPSLGLTGASSGTLTITAPAAAGTNTLTLPAGTTDFSATGGTSRVVKQTSAGGPFTVAQLSASDISGLGTMATEDSGTFFRVSNSFSEILFPGTARNNLGLGHTDDVEFASVTVGSTTLITSSVSLANGAGSSTIGTLTNGPASGNPTKWIPINDNGVVRHIPAW